MAETTLVSSLYECVTNDFYKIRKKFNKYSINEFRGRYFRTWFYSMSELFVKKKSRSKYTSFRSRRKSFKIYDNASKF